MKLEKIKQSNIEYNKWKAEMEETLKTCKQSQKEINDQLNKEEVMELSYTEAKELYEIVKFNINENHEIKKWVEELKAQEYDILKRAHYYPILNELDYLTDEEKRKFDDALCNFKNSYIMTVSTSWRNYTGNIDRETQKKVIEWLCEKGILTKNYQVECECGTTITVMPEQQYLDHQRYFELEKRQDLTEEEQKWFNEFEWSQDHLWLINCYDCEEDIDLVNMEQLKNNTKLYYKNITKPDMTYTKM